MIFKTIKGNLIFFITILLAFISLFIFFYFPSKFEALEVNSLRDKASVLNKMCAYAVSPALNFRDPDNIKEAAAGIIQNKDILYLIIEDEAGGIKFSFNKSLALASDYKLVYSKADPDKYPVYKTTQKVVYRNNLVGFIYAGYSFNSIRETLTNNRITITIITLFIFIVATLLVNIIGRYSLRPLTDITYAAKNISHKDLSIRVKESFGEIGELAAAFNLMIDKLEKSRVELEGWNRNLENVVQQRTKDLQKEIDEKILTEQQLIVAKNKAEEMNRVKSIFFANMSHELRTPLIGILGFTDILKNEITKPEQLEMIEVIARSGKRLGDTLNQILEISKIESDIMNIQLKPHDISEITENAMKIFKPAAGAKNLQLLSLHNSENCLAVIDERHFITILDNLINNAVKFTQSGSITVVTGIEKSGSGKWAYCQVIDSGIGISHEKIETVFEQFRQASEGFDRQFEGTGLGLSIAKKLTELMNGSISVQSELGFGSVFTIKFPASIS
jgi:signal transduction histidine kinase